MPPAPAPADTDLRGLVWGLKRWQFVLALGFGLLAFAWAANWLPQAYVHWLVKDSVKDLAEAARDSDITYAQAKTEATAIFKPVRWRLTHPAAGQWFHEGNPEEPVSWDLGSEPTLPFTGVPGGPDDVVVLAVVQGSNARDGVSLTFVGRD
ncbi:MAG TPA: hypothetical protein DCM05_03065 [Elusimicrobia bacterium]|nr:hypothetical protein [Elusimicrobiota bacterium]